MLRKAEGEIVCVAQFTANVGSADELLRELHSLMLPTHKERGCRRYELNQGIDDPRHITFIEKWADREAFDRHCSTPYIKKFFESLAPRLVQSQVVVLYKEVLR